MIFGSKKSDATTDGQTTAMKTETLDSSSQSADQATETTPSGGDVITNVETETALNQRQIPRETLQLIRSKILAANFGNVITVLKQSPVHKNLSLSDLDWLVIPALLNNQFVVAETRKKDSGFTIPIGIVLWASVSEDVDKRLSEELDKPLKLAPNEWKSGDIFWLIEVMGNRRSVKPMVDHLIKTVFKDKPTKYRTTDEDNNIVIKTWDRSAD